MARYGLFGAIIVLIAVGVAVVVDREGDDDRRSATTGGTVANTRGDASAENQPDANAALGQPITVPGAATTAPATTAPAPVTTAAAPVTTAARQTTTTVAADRTTTTTTTTVPAMPNTGDPILERAAYAALVLVGLGMLLVRAGRHRRPA